MNAISNSHLLLEVYSPDYEDLDYCKTKERDYCYLADANVGRKNTLIPELTRQRTDDKPPFSLSAYQAMY